MENAQKSTGNDEHIVSTADYEIISSFNQFSTKVKQGTIDVWWLFDDGGE